VYNLWITLGCLSRRKSGLEHGKKRKEKETQFPAKPMYIKDTRDKRQASRFPASDYSRHYKTLENIKVIGPLPACLFTASTE